MNNNTTSRTDDLPQPDPATGRTIPVDIELITTGGTIEKTYDERAGVLTNRGTIVQRMLRRLRLENTRVHVREVMSKDSLEMTDDDRNRILRAVKGAAELGDGVVILHGTDTLETTGEHLYEQLAQSGGPPVPIVLTGAMRPFEMVRSDALQNLTEALLAAKIMPAGIYAAAHNNILEFPGIKKDRELGTFIRSG